MNKKQRLSGIERGCTRIHSGVARLGLRVVMRLNNKSIKIETFK